MKLHFQPGKLDKKQTTSKFIRWEPAIWIIQSNQISDVSNRPEPIGHTQVLTFFYYSFICVYSYILLN